MTDSKVTHFSIKQFTYDNFYGRFQNCLANFVLTNRRSDKIIYLFCALKTVAYKAKYGDE